MKAVAGRKEDVKNYWTATDIGIMAACPRLYRYSIGKKDKVTTGDMARGSLMHRVIEPKNFFKENGSPKYKSAEKWANYCANQWQRTEINNGTSRGVPIIWRDDAEPYVLKGSIHGNCLAAYQYLVSKGRPIFSEYPFRFTLEYEGMGVDGKPAEREIKFRGRIDEIRERVLIDFKTGYSRIGYMETNHGYQLTIYELAFSVLGRKKEDFRRRVGVTDEQVARLEEQNLLLLDNVQVGLVQFLNWDQSIQAIPGVPMRKLRKFLDRYAGETSPRATKELNRILDEHGRVLLPPAELMATRSEYHARELIDLVDWFELIKSTGQYWPRRVGCDRCVAKRRCDEDTRKERESERPVQTKLFDVPYEENVKRMRSRGQTRFRFRVEEEDSHPDEAA
jgi:hypothetical protein